MASSSGSPDGKQQACTVDVSIWQRSPLDKGSKTAMCTLATRVPQIKPHKSVSQHNARATARESIVKTIDWLLKHPMKANEIWCGISNGTIVEDSPAPALSPAEAAPATIPTTFGKLRPTVIAGVYASMKNGPSRALLDLMNDKDPLALKDAFRSHFQVEDSDKIPDEVQGDPEKWILMMHRRGEEVGNRWVQWFAEAVSEDGEVDWSQVPLFKFFYKEGILEKVTHINGDTGTPPRQTSIPADWGVLDANSDDQARFDISGSPLFVKTFFANNQGPNKFRLDRAGVHMRNLATAASKVVEDKRGQARAIADAMAPVDLSTRADRLRRESLKVAREARQSGGGPAKKPRILKPADTLQIKNDTSD